MTHLQIWLQNHNRRLTQDAIDEALMEYIGMVEKQRDDLLAVAEHIQRCIPYGGFCQIHHGSATAADLDAAIASVKEK